MQTELRESLNLLKKLRSTISRQLEFIDRDIAKIGDPVTKLEALGKIAQMIAVLNKSVEGAAKLVGPKDAAKEDVSTEELMKELMR